MKKFIKNLILISILGVIVIGLGFGIFYYINFNLIKDPMFEIPIHNKEDVTGIQVFHDNRSTQLHNGFDFKLENNTEIFSPISGKISSISKHMMSNGYWIIDVFIEINMRWETFIAFEPWTQNESIIDEQITNISVLVGQSISQNQTLGFLNPVPASEFPHIHWSILKDGKYVSPYDYCSPKAASEIEWLCNKFNKYPEDY